MIKSKDRYNSTKDPEIEARRRLRISESLKGNKNGVGRSGNNAHQPGCWCGWCTGGSPSPGALNGNWRGGLVAPNGVGWNVARRVIWERDKVCRACGLPPDPNRRLDVHHVIARRDGGSNDTENLVGLHHGCHMKVEAGKMEIQTVGV